MVKNREIEDKEPVAKESSAEQQIDDKTTVEPLAEETEAKKKSSLDKRHKHTMPAVFRVLFSVLLMAFFSVIFTWFVFWEQNIRDADLANEFIQTHQAIATYSCLVIFLAMAVVAAITWRPLFTVGLSFAAISVVMFIHMQKFELRAAPLLPEDFQLADSVGDLADFVDGDAIARLVWGVVFVLAGSILLEYCARKVCGRDRSKLAWWDKFSLIPRVTWSLVAITVLVLVTKPVIDHEEIDWVPGIKYTTWNQTENYEDNGFVIGFLYNMAHVSTQPPEEYSEESLQKIAEKYRAIKAADDEREPLDEIVDNVVFIMNESFYDPVLIAKYYPYSGGDVTPNLHNIFRNYPSGYMYSPEYGGNTANVEFEGQTGLSNFWAMTVPYVNSLTKVDNVLAIASWAKGFGFDTTAIHAYDGTMYKRYLVYPKFGYDEFIDEDEMSWTEKDYSSPYYNDRSIYNEIFDVLEDADGPQLVTAITMQNHAPYNGAQYPVLEFKQRDPNDPNAWAMEASFQSLHTSDEYLREFLDKIDELDEKTVVIWFGDHAMGAMDKYIRSEDADDRNIAHFTPYFIYANFDIESGYTVSETTKLNAELGFEFPTRGIDLPTVTPNCLLNTMYNILGAEKPALFYLLDTVCEESPVLARAYYGDEIDMTEALKEYELVNYDVLSGKHYWNGN